MLHAVRRMRRFALIVVVLGALIPSIIAQAAIATVGTCAESALRTAIATAGSGGTVRFGLNCTGASAITLSSATPLTLTSDLTIDSNGHAVVLDGNRATRVFTIGGGAIVQLIGLTIRNGQSPTGANGGGIANSGTLTLTGCVVSGNLAQAQWSGINSVGGFGGGIRTFVLAIAVIYFLPRREYGDDRHAQNVWPGSCGCGRIVSEWARLFVAMPVGSYVGRDA